MKDGGCRSTFVCGQNWADGNKMLREILSVGSVFSEIRDEVIL